MLAEFASDLSRVLLFLRNVTKIAVYEWRDGRASPDLLHEAAISNLNAELQAKRSLQFAHVGAGNDSQFASDGMRAREV